MEGMTCSITGESYMTGPSRHASWVATAGGPGAKHWGSNMEEASGSLKRPNSRPERTCQQN